MTPQIIITALSRIVVILCLVWTVLVLPLLGGGSWGKTILSSWAKQSIFQDKKAGVPLLCITVPILLAATIATITITTTKAPSSTTSTSTRSRCHLFSRCGGGTACGGKWYIIFNDSVRWYTIVFLFVPCIVYTVSNIHRHLSHSTLSTDKQMMDVANAFGMIAIIVLSWIILPVTTNGPIERILQQRTSNILPGWDSTTMIQQFHMWSGRMIVLGGFLHGIIHSVRYRIQSSQIFWSYMIPPIQCWTNPKSYSPTICEFDDISDDGTNECSCYDHFVPFTGWVAGLGLVIIGISSMNVVRRTRFDIFAILHYITTPIVIVAVCIHYNKAVLYVSGSVLYYLACNVPRWIERRRTILHSCSSKYNSQSSPIQVVSVQRIEADTSHWDRPCVSITMKATETAMNTYQPGMYIRLRVPSISWISHPFTINQVFLSSSEEEEKKSDDELHSSSSTTTNNNNNNIRVICRVTGSFTKRLEQMLMGSNDRNRVMVEEADHSSSHNNNNRGGGPTPLDKLETEMFVSGWYNSRESLFDIIYHHDVIVIVAAGVGITPYLSLIANLQGRSGSVGTGSRMIGTTSRNERDGIMVNNTQSIDHRTTATSNQKKIVVVHWICRDQYLIEYCRKEYLDPSSSSMNDEQKQQQQQQCISNDVDIQIRIHHTGSGGDGSGSDDDNHHETFDNKVVERPPRKFMTPTLGRYPFSLSVFDAGTRICDNLGRLVLFVCIGWGGLVVTWTMYQQQEKEEYIQRLVTVVSTLVYVTTVAIVANIIVCTCSKTKRGGWNRVAVNDDDDDDDNENGGAFDTGNSKEIEMGLRKVSKMSTSYKDSMTDMENDDVNEDNDNGLVLPLERSIPTISPGRPSLVEELAILNEGCAPAVMCCVPRKLEVKIHERCGGTLRVPIYSESFET